MRGEGLRSLPILAFLDKASSTGSIKGPRRLRWPMPPMWGLARQLRHSIIPNLEVLTIIPFLYSIFNEPSVLRPGVTNFPRGTREDGFGEHKQLSPSL